MKWVDNNIPRIGIGKDGTIFRVEEDGSLHIFWSERSGVRAIRRKDKTEPKSYPEQYCKLGGTVENAITIAEMVEGY